MPSPLNPMKRPDMNLKKTRIPSKQKTLFLLIGICSLALASWACGWFPLAWDQWYFGKPPDQPGTGSTDQWEVTRCNALEEVRITLEDFSENTILDSNGSEEGQECSYTHQIENTSGESIRVLYYDHFAYGENPPPNDYEFGWNKTAQLQPGAVYSISSFISLYPKQPLYRNQLISIAVIYDNPGCGWIVAGGVHSEVLQIAKQDLIQPPCQRIGAFNNDEAVPDLTQGLIQE